MRVRSSAFVASRTACGSSCTARCRPASPSASSFAGAILGVRIVARGARHLRRAAAELEVAALARVGRAAARMLRPARPPSHVHGVVREQHRVALRAGAVDPLRARAGLARAAASRRTSGLCGSNVGTHRRIRRVLARAVVARLAADAELDEVLAVELLLASSSPRPAARRAESAVAGGSPPRNADLVVERAREPARRSRDVRRATSAIGGSTRSDSLP